MVHVFKLEFIQKYHTIVDNNKIEKFIAKMLVIICSPG